MPQKIRIIGVPMDLGASRRGVDMGPSALRVAGLQARIKQLGKLPASVMITLPSGFVVTAGGTNCGFTPAAPVTI